MSSLTGVAANWAIAQGSGPDERLSPTWMATACLLNGHRPPDLDGPFRYVHLGSGDGATTTAVAAAHPDASVWAWDWRVEHVESTRRRRDALGLSNVTVHERSGLPTDLGGELADIVVVQGVMEYASNDLRDRIVKSIGANLRPGGLVCVTYKTMVGWTEIAPVVTLMRHVAQRYSGDPARLVDHVLELLATLREDRAQHLTERPSVVAWLDELATASDRTIVDDYLRDRFRPMSHAQVAGALAPTGCVYLGSARLTDDLDLNLDPTLTAIIAGAATPALRETYRDLAVRRMVRHDVFRLGPAPLSDVECATALAGLELAGSAPTGEPPAAELTPDVWQRLCDGRVAAADLGPDPIRSVRILLEAEQAHPVTFGGSPRDAQQATHAEAP